MRVCTIYEQAIIRGRHFFKTESRYCKYSDWSDSDCLFGLINATSDLSPYMSAIRAYIRTQHVKSQPYKQLFFVSVSSVSVYDSAD